MSSEHPVYQHVQTHSEMSREAHPAVNIKVNAGPDSVSLPLELGGVSELTEDGTAGPMTTVYTDPEFTHEWIEAHLTEDERRSWWDDTCEEYFALAKERAEETFPESIQVYSEGRSGGWLVVFGLGDPEEWTPEQVERWIAFAKDTRQIADDIPRGYLWNIHANVFEPWAQEQAEKAAAEAAGPDADIEVYLTPVPVEGIDTERIGRALQAAHNAFWAKAVEHFPEVTSGDVDPMMTSDVEQRMAAWLASWLHFNHPAPSAIFAAEHDVDLDDDRPCACGQGHTAAEHGYDPDGPDDVDPDDESPALPEVPADQPRRPIHPSDHFDA